MARQDAERFDQRHRQHQEDDEGHDADELAPSVAERKQGEEGDHRSHRADGDGAADGANPGDRCGGAAQAVLPLPGDALADYHGIVDHDAGDDEEREQCQHVDAQADGIEEHQRTQKRNRNAHGDPQRQAHVEDHEQGDENQYGANDGVAGDGGDAIRDEPALVLPELDNGARRPGVVGEAPLDGLRNLLRGLADGGVDADEYRRPAVHLVDQVQFLEAVPYRRYVAHPHHGTVGSRHQHDVLELFGAGAFRQRTDDHLAVIGAELAAGQVEGRLAHQPYHLVDG